MSDDPVQTRREGAVGVMTFNRADKLNALNMPMMLAIEAALGTLEADPQVRCIVFTGADDRAFMAGGDITDLATRRPASWYDETRCCRASISWLPRRRWPRVWRTCRRRR